jgi:DNA-directed RNA polymerase specialized sigma24 family protein
MARHSPMLYYDVAADTLSRYRRFLWDFAYRATGTIADADTVLRECYPRTAQQSSVKHESDARQFLTSGAARIALETLRQRKRRQYVGCWLPAPVETGNAASPGPRPNACGGLRYDVVESASTAFLLALEGLEARERILLTMCDALGLAVQDAAAALDLTSATGKTALHSARRKMQQYESAHVPPTADIQAAVAAVLSEFLSHLQEYNLPALEKTLASDARALFDGGGEFAAPAGSVFGCETVARLLARFTERSGPVNFSFRMLNGLPAALGHAQGRPRWASRFVLAIEVSDGLVARVHAVLATPKLTAIRFDPL